MRYITNLLFHWSYRSCTTLTVITEQYETKDNPPDRTSNQNVELIIGHVWEKVFKTFSKIM